MTKININAVKTLLKKNESRRPILASISYQDDRIAFTDSYGLVEIDTSNAQSFNLNVFTGRLEGGEYPRLDRIKPAEYALEPAENMHVEFKEGQELYIIDDYPFGKKQVDQTFKTVGLDFTKQVGAGQIKLHKRPTSASLVYQKNDVYILVLGLYKDRE